MEQNNDSILRLLAASNYTCVTL